MNLRDEQERQWTAVEHNHPVHQIDGPVNLDVALSTLVRLNGKRTRCFLGAAHNAVRVNFKCDATGTWWHITQRNQPMDRKVVSRISIR